MKLGLKRKIIVVFVCVLAAVTVLDASLASYFTKRQNQDAAFDALKRDLLTWQDELQDITSHMRTVALSAIGETVALNQLSELKALDYKLADAVDKDKEVKEAARTLAFSKSVSLNRLHLVLRSGGFSAIAVYIDGRLSHQVSVSEVGMFVQRGNGGRIWVKAAADANGNLPLRSWPAWKEGEPPTVADPLPPVDRPQVAFTYPSADNMLIEVAVPVEGIIDYSLPQGESRPPELSVIDPRIAGSASDSSIFAANRPPSPFAMVVFQKRIDQEFLQAVERKTGMWPMLFSPDGRYRQQLGPLNLSLRELLPDLAGASARMRVQNVSNGPDSFYAATLPWQFERQPGFVLALAASQDSTLQNIRQTVVAILTVTGLILALSIGVGIFWVGRFIDPIISLTNAVKAIGLVSRLGRGKQPDYRLTSENLRPLAIQAPGEIGDLAWAFDFMIGELHHSFDSLEQRVQERTSELSTLHQILEEQNRQLEEQSAELSASNHSLLEEIGERRLMEDLLRLQEEQFRSLAENSPDNIARYDREGRIRYWNSRLHVTMDLPDFITSRAHIGKTTTELYPDGRFDDYEAAVKSVIESGQEIEYEVVGPDIGAGIRHYLVRMVAERDPHGEVIGVLAIGRDITERKRIEETLKFIAQSSWKEGGESFLVALARYLGKMLDVDYVIVDKLAEIPDHAETVALYAKGEVLPNMQYNLEHTPCRSVMEGGLCCYPANVQQQFPEDTLLVDMQVESYTGLPLWDSSGTVIGLIAVMDGKPIGDAALVISALQLVATRAAAELEREQSERALAESRQFLNQVIDAIPDPVFVKDREHRWILLNQEFCDFIGHPMERLLGQSDYDFFPAQEADVFWAQDEVVFNSGHEVINEEDFTDLNGVTHNILTKKICYTDDRGQQYLVGIILDITERKQYELNLLKRAQLEEQLSGLAASVPGFMFTIRVAADGHTSFPFASAGIEQLFGLRPDDIRDDAAVLRARYHPDDLPRMLVHMKETHRTLAPFRIEIRIIHPDKGMRWIEIRSTPQRQQDGSTEWHGLMIDITERKQAEAEKQHLINILEQSVDFIGSADMQGRLLYHNRAARRMVGLPEYADLSNMNIADMHPEWALKMIEKQGIPTLLKDGVWHGETAIRHRDGREIPVSQLLVLHRDADGKPLFHSTIMRDITERKQAENKIRALNAGLEQRVQERTEALRLQTHYLRALIDTLPMLVWLKDKESRFLVVNQAMAVACTHSVDDMVGKSDLDVWPREHAEAYRAADNEVMATGQRKIVEELIDDVRGTLWVETFKAPVLDDDGRVLGTVGIALDISDRKAMETAREAALAEAERLVRLRSEFMARMSHELRTPLNGILGYAQIIRGEKQLNERYSVMLDVIQQSGEYLLRLINDILDFAKIEAGKQELSLSDIPLAGFLNNLTNIIKVKAEQKHLAFVCDMAADVPRGIRADETRLRQVLLNLLANAVKYSEQGQISLRVSVLEQDRLRFEIQDTGIGIDAGQLETIFQPFEQAGNRQHHNGGSGLGLVISRELVRLMGSDIHVTSRVGEGSTFWFDLDVKVVDVYGAIMPSEQRVAGYRGPSKRVLVVDDIDENRALLIDILSRLGFETAEAVNGRACLDSAEILAPDLILLDIVMPEMDGMETSRRLRRLPGFEQTPIIAISASASGSDVGEVMKSGVNVFLSKPIDINQLITHIAGLLKLDWIYTRHETESSQQQKLNEPLVAPPLEEMRVLYQLAQEGSMRDIIRQAEYLGNLDDRYRPFAVQLRALAQGYQSKAILDLVDRHINRYIKEQTHDE